MPNWLRGTTLIMTVAQSKGLEFDDVLLLDFFSDSCAYEDSWRVLLTYLEFLHGLTVRAVSQTVIQPRIGQVLHTHAFAMQSSSVSPESCHACM